MAKIKNGQDYKTVQVDEGYPVIGSGGQFTYASEFMYDKASVLLGRKGTIDKPLYIEEPFWTVDTMYYTEVNNKTPAKYLYYLALTIQFDRYATNTALPSMTQENLSNFLFAVPDNELDKQIIANFLDHETAKIDTLIEKQQQLIKLLKEKRQAVISHAVTKGLNPDAPMRDSGVEWLGEVPAHWVVVPLMSVADVVDPNPSHRNPVYTDDGFPFISTVEFVGIDDVEINTSRRVADVTVVEQEERCQFRKGSIAFSRKGTIGEVRILPEGVRLALLDSVCVINCGDKLDYEFFYQQARSSVFDSQLAPLTRGAALKQISVGRVRSVRVFLPPLAEQNEIVRSLESKLRRIDESVSLSEKQISLLIERRTALISAAVTGKIDVRGPSIKFEVQQ